jgi:hypothetical protein
LALRGRFVRVLVLVFLLILLALFVSLVRADTSEGATNEKASKVEMTERQRADFVRGAKEVAGLNDAQIERVLQHPEMIDDIPVSKKFYSRTIEVPSTTGSSSGQTRAAYTPVTRKKLAVLEYEDADGQLVFKLEAVKTWVFDGDRVLSGSMNDVTAWIREDARYSPSTGGWRYAEEAESHTERYVPYAGRAYGGHKSTLAARFDLFYYGDSRPTGLVRQGISQIGQYNGTCNSTSYAPKGGLKITSGPSGYLRSTSASFAFSSPEDAEATFKCKLDNSGVAACSSPKTYTSLSQGKHAFRLEGVDSSGNAMIAAPLREFTVDSIAPSVASVAPALGATGVGAGTNVAAVFSEDVEAITLIDNFTLVEVGTTTPVDAYLSYDPSTRRVVLNPVSTLVAGAKYTAKINGGSGGVTDRAGNLLAADRVWSFTVAN